MIVHVRFIDLSCGLIDLSNHLARPRCFMKQIVETASNLRRVEGRWNYHVEPHALARSDTVCDPSIPLAMHLDLEPPVNVELHRGVRSMEGLART